MADSAAQLASVNNAIAAIEAGAQAYERGDGTRVVRADLQVLYAQRRDLESALAAGHGRTGGAYQPLMFTRRTGGYL